MTWVAIQQTNHISQSMCMLGTMNMIDQNNEVNNADIILYSGESADSQVIAVNTMMAFSTFFSCPYSCEFISIDSS